MVDTTKVVMSIRERQAKSLSDSINNVASAATTADRSLADSIAIGSGTIGTQGIIDITPTIAAVIMQKYNKFNRNINYRKIDGYKNAMNRGEWKLNHQGVAFYVDGKVADGQHRLAATALSGVTCQYSVFNGFEKDSIDSIDPKNRDVGDALFMKGVKKDGKLLGAIAQTVMGYQHRVEHGVNPSYSVIQVENEVLAEQTTLELAVRIASASLLPDAPLGKAEAATATYLLLEGGYDVNFVKDFIQNVQTEVGAYGQSPELALYNRLQKAKKSSAKSNALTKMEKLAHIAKGAALLFEHKAVTNVKWTKNESLPSNVPPVPNAELLKEA